MGQACPFDFAQGGLWAPGVGWPEDPLMGTAFGNEAYSDVGDRSSAGQTRESLIP